MRYMRVYEGIPSRTLFSFASSLPLSPRLLSPSSSPHPPRLRLSSLDRGSRAKDYTTTKSTPLARFAALSCSRGSPCPRARPARPRVRPPHSPGHLSARPASSRANTSTRHDAPSARLAAGLGPALLAPLALAPCQPRPPTAASTRPPSRWLPESKNRLFCTFETTTMHSFSRQFRI